MSNYLTISIIIFFTAYCIVQIAKWMPDTKKAILLISFMIAGTLQGFSMYSASEATEKRNMWLSAQAYEELVKHESDGVKKEAYQEQRRKILEELIKETKSHSVKRGLMETWVRNTTEPPSTKIVNDVSKQ